MMGILTGISLKSNNVTIPTERIHPMQRDLTKGSITKELFRFAVPYLAANFLQTFYGLTDLFITGQFKGAASISGVSIGSQLMHMLTVIIVGLAMGTTVTLSRAVGAKDQKTVRRCIGNTITLFILFAAVLTFLLIVLIHPIIAALSTPAEAVGETRNYMLICFIGIPFITAYNVIASIFRGLGDTTTPMIFVAIAGVINIGLDYLMIGPMDMGAAGAALATVLSQAVSVILALIVLHQASHRTVPAHTDELRIHQEAASSASDVPRGSSGKATAGSFPSIHLVLADLKPEAAVMKSLVSVGIPISCQDGFIQVSFLVITAIANARGVETAAAVGIVEKIISFLFLVPSSMLGTLSAFAAQNAGAGLHDRSRKALHVSIATCSIYGAVIFLLCQVLADQIVSWFAPGDPQVVTLGGQYLRSYAADVCFGGIQFCFSGYFSAYGKAIYSFIHNITSITCVRIPGAWLASKWFPDTLYPMGWAPPLGSLLSIVICLAFYHHLKQLSCSPDKRNVSLSLRQ